MEVGGHTLAGHEPSEISSPALKGVSSLLRDLLQQIDERVDAIREG